MTACCVQKSLMSAFRISYLPHFQLSCSCWSDLTSRNLVAGEVTARAPRHYGLIIGGKQFFFASNRLYCTFFSANKVVSSFFVPLHLHLVKCIHIMNKMTNDIPAGHTKEDIKSKRETHQRLLCPMDSRTSSAL